MELAKGGHVTPLAKDTLAARRVTVIPAGATDPNLPADLAPVADIRRVAIGNDHTGDRDEERRSCSICAAAVWR